MTVSLGIYTLILIFFFIVIPGYLYRRLYYHGEFSKQLDSYTGPIPNLVYSFVTGFVFSLVYIFVINLIQPNTIDIETILNNFDRNFISATESHSNEEHFGKFVGLYKKLYTTYLPYLLSIYLFSAFGGYIFSKFVLFFNLDARIKLLRFKNSWHYLFTGRILRQGKFKHKKKSSLRIRYNYIDVLVAEESQIPKLYSGLYVDYTLNSNDPCKLEKLYLIKPVRYKKVEGKMVPRSIPGNILTILGENILNINCTYIFEKSKEKKFKRYTIQKNILWIGQLLNFSIFVTISIALLFEINLFDFAFLTTAFEYGILKKLLLILFVNITLGFLTPFIVDKNKEKVKFIGWSTIFSKVVIFFILFLIIYYHWLYDKIQFLIT